MQRFVVQNKLLYKNMHYLYMSTVFVAGIKSQKFFWDEPKLKFDQLLLTCL